MAQIDMAYPSVVLPKSSADVIPQLNSDALLCPKHQKEMLRRSKEEKKRERKKRLNSVSLFGKNPIERKLEKNGIKMKVKFKKSQIQPSNQEDLASDHLLSMQEISVLTTKQLEQLASEFSQKIETLTREEGEIVEENTRHKEDKSGLKMTVVRLENLALRVMKPWHNYMPQSEEMTRVLLLN